MDIVKIGIIGTGDAANFHTLAFKSKQDVKVKYVSAYDISEKSLRLFCNRLKLQACSGFDELIKTDIDAILITVPHFLHCDYVKKVAEAGKHVLCEKPMAPTLEECDEMIEVTKRAGVKFMIAENHRFLPVHKEIKRLIDTGILGDVYLGRTYEGAFVPLKHFTDPAGWQFTYDKGGGGVLADQGVHKFGLFNWLLGEIDSGQAWLGKAVNSPPNKGEDNTFMLVRYKNGAMVEMAVSSTASHPLNNNTELIGTKGHVLEDHSWEKPLKVFSKHPDAVKKGEYYELSMEHGAYPKYYLISAFHEDTHFAECVLNDTTPEFTPGQAKEAVAGVLLGYLSAKKGAAAKMDELKKLAGSKGTKHLLQGLEDVVLRNYPQLKW